MARKLIITLVLTVVGILSMATIALAGVDWYGGPSTCC